MGMEDRDWYRDKRIDWEHGGLKDRRSARRRSSRYVWWMILAAVLFVLAVIFFRPLL